MARFGKKVLSQYLRTKCDKQLRLSLYDTPELQALGWPIPLEARPTGRILRDRGNEWEQAKVQDLEAAFGLHLRGIKKDGKYIRTPLAPVLSADPVSPTFIIQGRFEDPILKATFLQNIGLESVQLDSIPQFTAFEPDIMVIRTAADRELEILPDGNLCPIPAGSQRKAILVFDIKHVGEANSSYSSEVVLYAVLLANWLRLRDLETQFFVSERLGLWTRAKETSELSRLVGTNPGASITDRLHAFLTDIEWVDFGVFFQGVDHFIKQDLPRVLAVGKWTDLDWHLDSRCSTCDFLGHHEWLPIEHRAVVDAHRGHYCETAAKDTGHLSQITTITRGSRKTLCQAGYADLGSVSCLSPTDSVFEKHNALRADRNHLPQRASALITGDVTVAPGTTTIDFPKSADLEVFIAVNFDHGTGLLSALGSEAHFTQREPEGQKSNIQRTWEAEAKTLLTSTIDEERNLVISFLSRLAEIFSFVFDKRPERGGALAASTRIHVYFWDRRQFKELAKAIGRHFNSVVMPHLEDSLLGLVWLFPPDELLREDALTLANPITFMKSVIQRHLQLPVAHCLTLFKVAEVYHREHDQLSVPGQFHRDPFSDTIPRERIYEIWSQEPIVNLGTTQTTRPQCIAEYSETVRKQVAALRAVVCKFRADMADRLKFAARSLKIENPFNFQKMSEDGRLWYGWTLLEEACSFVGLQRAWSAEPEELEANYSIVRLPRLLGIRPDGVREYEVRASCRDCKFRDNEPFLALQDESTPSFLDLRIQDLLDPDKVQQVLGIDRTLRMSDLFAAELMAFDRENLQVLLKLQGDGDTDLIRNFLLARGTVDITREVSLLETAGPPMAKRVGECLRAIGRPPIALAAPETYAALGHEPAQNPPGKDSITPVARVLWDAEALAQEDTGIPADTIDRAIQQIVETQWPLNQSQADAIAHCLSHRLSMVWGPPGTGKTTTAAAVVVARILAARQCRQHVRILVTAPTYTAWEKLFCEILDLLERRRLSGILCYRLYSSTHSERALLPRTNNIVRDIEAVYDDRRFGKFMKKLTNPQSIILAGAVAHQCYRIAKHGKHKAMAELFDQVVIDESSQLDVATSLFPLCLMAAQAGVALFGDHLQMPPVVITQPPSGAEWLVGSIQTYLRERHGLPLQNLLINYRSARAFVDFGKRIGYPPDLTAHSERLKLHQIRDDSEMPVDWQDRVPWFSGLSDIFNVERPLVAVTYEDGKAGQANEFEADIVCGMVQHLFLNFSQFLDDEQVPSGELMITTHSAHDAATFWDRGVGVVTPHRAQRALIVQRLRGIFPTHDPQAIDAAVDTVERFQGGQRDTIIISFGVGDPDLISEEESFLLHFERTNVAISRARAKCILVISEDLAYHLPSDRDTILTSKAVKTYVSDFCRAERRVLVSAGSNSQRKLTVRWHQRSD